MSVFSKLCTDIVDFGGKKSNPRNQTVSKITIHHMAGVSAGNICAKTHLISDRDASANYYIGNNGDICGGVSEDRRAWTSKSPWNDNRAITIEVSNFIKNDNWPVSDAAYKSLIRLCADICQRYNIVPHFTGDKNGTLTAHYMFAATVCPGPMLKNLLANGTIERDINAAISQQNGGKTAGIPQPIAPVQNSEKVIWDFLQSKIGNAYGTAGLMGNLYSESKLDPKNLQDSYEKKLGMTDREYTEAVDSGKYTKDQFIRDKAGYGLAQWTFWSRKENLYNFKGSRSIGDLQMQLDFLWEELSRGYTAILQSLKDSKTVYEASTVVLTQFERPAGQSEAMKQKRATFGQAYYDRYANSPTSKSGTLVRINTETLNIRKGPGINFSVTGTVKKGEVYTITQELNGWGQLKSGAGWIKLSYTVKV